MEAHAGAITIGIDRATKTRRRFLTELRAAIRRRRLERSYAGRINGVPVRSLPGSEHTHLLRRPPRV